MSFPTAIAVPARLEPYAFIRLAALGTAARSPTTCSDICDTIEDIAGDWWVPHNDTVAKCIDALLTDKSLSPADQQSLVITPSGWRILLSLLALPVGSSACSLGQVGLRLKLAYLDLVPVRHRQRLLTSAIQACHAEIAEYEHRCRVCAFSQAAGLRWIPHQAERLRQSLRWMQSMASQAA